MYVHFTNDVHHKSSFPGISGISRVANKYALHLIQFIGTKYQRLTEIPISNTSGVVSSEQLL
jgi:hypothetical protein